MVSPTDSEVEVRKDYFEDWLEDLSTASERDGVLDRASAKDFIKATFDKDPGLSNLADGMDAKPGLYDILIDGNYVQALIERNTSRVPLKELKARPRHVIISRSTTLVGLVPKKDKITRRKLIKGVYTARLQKSVGVTLSSDKRGRLIARSLNGRFVSHDYLLRRADPFIKLDPKVRGKVQRLVYRGYTK